MSTIQIRRGTSASATTDNPTLAAGEIGFETDTGKFKIGDGATGWTSLLYSTDVSRLPASVELITGVAAAITANETAAVNTLTPVNATAGAITVALPTGQVQGSKVVLTKTDSSTNAVTVSGSIRGAAGTASMGYQYQVLSYVADANGSWWPNGDLKPSSYFAASYDAIGAATAVKGLPLGLTGATAATRFVGATTSGAPTTGTFLKGDWIIDQTAAIWVCTTAGTPGTWGEVSGGGGSGNATAIDGVTVSGTPSSGQVLTATSGTAADWQTPTGGGGGSTTVSTVNLGSLGSTETLTAPSAISMQYGTLTASTAITLPAPVAGDEIILFLTQNSTGGYEPTFVGEPVAYPQGQPVWLTAASVVNVVQLLCPDGVTWQVIPGTSGVTSAEVTVLKIDGASATNTAGMRIVGSQSTGTAPTYGSPVADDVVFDSVLPGFWLYSGSQWDAVGGGGGANELDGVTVTGTPSAGQVLTATSGTAADWQAPTAAPAHAFAQYAPATAVTYSTSSATSADVDATNLAVSIVAPASGNVKVTMSGAATTASGKTMNWQVRNRTAATVLADCLAIYNATERVTVTAVITGLTPGTTYNLSWGFTCTQGSASGTIYAGGGLNSYGPALFYAEAI